MKKITLLLITFFGFALGFSQTELLNLSFDASGSESIWSPIADAASNPAEVTIAYNASGNSTGATELSGVNTSNAAGRAYIFRYDNASFDFGASGGVSISMDVKIDVALSGTNLVFETQVSKVGGGVVVVTNNNLENSVAVGTGWVNLTFDMTPNPAEFNNSGTELYFYFNMAAGAFAGAGGTIFVDNIVVTGSAPAAPTCSDGIENGNETGVDCGGPDCAACPATEPAISAPIPPLASTEVYSIFSDTYTNTDPTKWTEVWGSGVEGSDLDIGGDIIKKYTDLNFQAITLSALVDISPYDYFHIDVWTPISNAFDFKVEDWGANGTDEFPNVDDTEVQLASAVSQTAGVWVGHDFAIADFVSGGLTGTANVGRLQVILGNAAGGTQGTAFIDNLYLYKGPKLSTNSVQLASFKIYPNPTESSWNLKSKNENISSISVFDILGKSVISLAPNSNEATIDGSSLKSGLYFAQVKTANGVSSLKLVKQ